MNSKVPYNTTELNRDQTIWIITDIHYLSPTLHDNDEAFRHIQNTGAGKDLVYSNERMQALIEQAKIEKPALLIVSGDLTLNGELESFRELANHFQQLEDNGTHVLVIPGNHDISSGWARSFFGDKQIVAEQVSPKEFEQLFANFGYNQAAAKDAHSLSYVAQPFTNMRFLMIDSNIYTHEKSSTAPKTNGILKTETLSWIDEQLAQAKQDNVLIVPIMHHNVLNHHEMMSSGFQLDNANDLMALYNKHHVNISFSGHIHTQSIQEQSLGDVHHTEIVTQAFSLTPAPIGTLKFVDNAFHYHYTALDWQYFLKKYPTTNVDLLDHKSYLSKVFYDTTHQLVHHSLRNHPHYSVVLGDELADIISPLNEHFFTGELLTQAYLDTNVYNQHAYQLIAESDESSFLIRYINRTIGARLNQSMQDAIVPIK
ncbi:MAG: metallophosphoesterase [Aerococcaceae bacterium]|nr:metallophosphoesterase [Aerococcaceae bacterium]